MKRLITLEFETLHDLLAYRANARVTAYTVDQLRHLSISCSLTTAELATAMSFNATPIYEESDDEGLLLSDIISSSPFKNSYNNKIPKQDTYK